MTFPRNIYFEEYVLVTSRRRSCVVPSAFEIVLIATCDVILKSKQYTVVVPLTMHIVHRAYIHVLMDQCMRSRVCRCWPFHNLRRVESASSCEMFMSE